MSAKLLPMNPGDTQFLSVTDLNRLLNQVLEESFPQIPIQAEISELTRAASGHIYFTLKDAKSQVSAVMWRGTAQSLSFRPEAGMAVVCQGRPNIYHANGRFQIVVNQMSPAGEGLLKKKFLELKAKLEAEGYFSAERKRSLPFLPRAIGLVTSRTGAVIHDMMVKFQERMPVVPLFLVDVRVQGEGAAQEIADGIRLLNERAEVDVIIVARGGGSLEDLWAFNEEAVVKAVFASKIPVVSGVGHESDITLCDLAADVRAPTPTAAAEFVVPKREDLLRRIAELDQRLHAFRRWLEPWNQRLDELSLALERRTRSFVQSLELRVGKQSARLQAIQPQRLIESAHMRLDRLSAALGTQIQRGVVQRRHAVERLESKFQVMNPLRVLERGYAIVESKGAVVKSPSQVTAGDSISVRVAEGVIGATVTGEQ